MSDDKVVRSVDLTEEGADAIFNFIAQFHEAEGKNQAYLTVELEDGTVVDKAEIVESVPGDDDDDPIYILRLSGI